MRVPTPAQQKEFYKFFKKPVNHFWNVAGFDIVKFDDYLGTPRNKSMKEFVKEEHGERAVELIEEMNNL